MTMVRIVESYKVLRQQLGVQLGRDVLGEISIALPDGDADEQSFSRLVGWGYVLFRERGRVVLPFLSKLPPRIETSTADTVEAMRTILSHNTSIESSSDREKMKKVFSWFRKTAKRERPGNVEEWSAAFLCLCDEILGVLTQARQACAVLGDLVDGPALAQQLLGNIDRNWEAFRFDGYVLRCAERLGVGGVDAVQFRKRHLDEWRKVVVVADVDSLELLLERRIEADLLNLIGDATSLSGREILERIAFADARELGALMWIVRRGVRLSRAPLSSLLEELAGELKRRDLGDEQ